MLRRMSALWRGGTHPLRPLMDSMARSRLRRTTLASTGAGRSSDILRPAHMLLALAHSLPTASS
eukprot:CAMPEP_0183796102 /NCGR_PEP_ID=MMETSP0803_2-20130417/8240_1 /TAXON_ID=195967 /ORGANISM="Crustomastix stigmata, Strain CCMP3273" /LENGTH=63 /DNA_ID=CAMNT_0026040707 /DNA_START=47 /DNA_END=235 /DNA_ORIENTATION=-